MRVFPVLYMGAEKSPKTVAKNMPFDKSVVKNYLLVPNQNICCGLVGTQKNRLNETVLLNTQNKG